MTSFQITCLLALNVGFNVGGSLALKHATLSDQPITAVLGCGCYILGAAIYVALLQSQPLAVMAVVTSILGLVCVVLTGVLVFGETLVLIQWLGLTLGLLAVVLISLPSFSS